jgi:serine/threonine protein phosphatase PrpC
VKQATFHAEHTILLNEETRTSGSTAVFSVVRPIEYDHENRYATRYEVTLANVGDSLGMIISGQTGDVKFVTRAHTPSDPLEKQRIEANGGFVHRARVDGRLAMSRSMGDAKYKDLYQSNKLMNFLDQKVTSEADVAVLQVDAGDILLLCSDGVTADLSTKDIASFIMKYMILQPIVEGGADAGPLRANDIDIGNGGNKGSGIISARISSPSQNESTLPSASTQAKHAAIRPEERVAREFSRSHVDPGTVASRLLDLSFAEGSTDNMTALLVSFIPGDGMFH